MLTQRELDDFQKFEEDYFASLEAKKSLSKFIKFMWPVLEPGTPYIHGWHIDAVCEHLEAVTYGHIKNLVMNIPPRHMKSLSASVCWPMWEWLTFPHHKFLCSSYAMNLSIRDSLKSRRLITSQKFQRFYGHLFKILKDQNAKIRFDNNHYGYRLATSVDGMGTGEGGDRVMCLEYNTKIDLKIGSLNIGYIVENKINAEVWSYNKTKNRNELKPILNWYQSEANDLIEIHIDKINTTKLICTPNHPIFILGKGYVNAEHIQIGEMIRDIENKQRTIIYVKKYPEKRKMYNIEIKDNNNYYANKILVHNCDDPHSTSQADSELKREKALVWWSETMSTRLNNPKTGAKVIIMQRQNARDLSGYVLAREGYEHLCLPAEYEGSKKVTSIGFVDPRKEDGELLWPDRIDKQELERLKKEMGPYAVAGQLQQRPSPRGGGLIKRQWFNYFRLLKNSDGRISVSEYDYIVHSWDTAFKTGEENDYSVNTIWGVKKNGYYLLYRWKDRVEFPELERICISLANQITPNLILIEDKASGQSLIQALRKRTRLPIRPIKVDKDKYSRLNACSGIFESGLIHLPEGEPWVEDYIQNIITFPTAPYDDDVDSTTQAINHLAFKAVNNGTMNQNINIIGR